MTDSVQQIQQRLTCSVCLDKFKQPKLLPCQHTFCLTPCLANLVEPQTRRIKCPECRTTHMIPINGIGQFPNNITIMGFLDLDLTNVERSNTSNALDKCALCLNKRENLIKCIDCSKMFCTDCKSTHIAELKNETQQLILNLRRTIPKLSEKVGNFEQKQTIVKQNFESIKNDVSTMVAKLIDELKNRERCLLAEAEVYMESHIRTIGLEQENAEIELASVSSFCDAADVSLSKQDQIQDNEFALLKKQANNYQEEMKTLNQNMNISVNKLKFKAPNLDDLFSLIQSFGELVLMSQISNYNATAAVNNQFNQNQINIQNQTNGYNYNQNQQNNRYNNSSADLNATWSPSHHQQQQQLQQQQQQQQQQQPDYRRRRPTWNRNNRDPEFENQLNNTLPMPTSNTNRNATTLSSFTPRPNPIFGPNPFAANNSNNNTSNTNANTNTNSTNNQPDTQRSGNNTDRQVNHNTRNQSNPPPRPGSRPIFGGAPSTTRSADNHNIRNNSPQNSDRRPRLIRSDTFELENPSNDAAPHVRPPNNQNNIDVHDLYNVRRRPRARTPVTFAVMLDEPNSNIHFEVPTTNSMLTEPLLENPKIDYASKTRAKLIIGKQGREHGEFVWPIGVAVNPVGKHILVADSNNHRIQIFEADGRFVKLIGSQGNRDGKFDCVSDVTVDAMANVFIVDRHNHRIQIFDRYCRFLRCLGSGPGSAPGELHFPWGIAVNRFSEVFVCDKENNRVCVFHLTGRFMRSFGILGTRPGQFDKPYYIHVTSDNKILVSDCSNHRIQVLDPYGNVLHVFGREGSEPGQLKHPRGITTDPQGFILVADSGNNRIQVFRPDGSYVCHFGSHGTDSGKFRGIEGITMSATGDVIVCDKENHRVQLL